MARRTAGTWEEERLGSNLARPRLVKDERNPAGIPAPCGRVPRTVIRDCTARHPWRLMLEGPNHRCRHEPTQQWHAQQTSSTSSRRSWWCTVTAAGPPPCRTTRRQQRAQRQSLVTNHHQRRARQTASRDRVRRAANARLGTEDSRGGTPVTHGADEPPDEPIERTPKTRWPGRFGPPRTTPPPAPNGLQAGGHGFESRWLHSKSSC
jgi:hypothetical protein